MATTVLEDLPGSPEVKKPKLDENFTQNTSLHANIKDLSDFEVTKILSNNTKAKSVCLQGTFKSSEGVGIVLLEKTAFEEETLRNEGEFFTKESALKKIFDNDIYGNYEYFPKPELNSKINIT